MKKTLLTMVLSVCVGVLPAMAQETAPRAMLSITFDDASRSQHEHGLRIAQEYGLVGTLFVGTHGVEQAQQPGGDWAMDWTAVQDFLDAGWEIGSHSHTHPDNMMELPREAVEAEIVTAASLLQQHLGFVPDTYASPHGRFNDQVVDVVLEHHTYHMRAWGGNEGRNPLTQLNPRDIGRLNVTETMTAAYICGEMLQAALNDQWLVLIFHRIVPGEAGEYEVSVDNFSKMLHCAEALQDRDMLQVVPVTVAAKRVEAAISSN